MSGFNVRIPTLKQTSEGKSSVKKTKIEEISVSSNEATECLNGLNKLDTNEKFYNIEDKIAVSIGYDKIIDEFMEISALLRESINNYIDGKTIKENNIAKLAKLRRLTRLCHYSIAQLRKETTENLDIVDAKVLQLQNTTSEVLHIQKEIDRCLDFSAGDENLELVSIEEFYQNAPETISKPEITKKDEHQQYLARLTYENEQRKQMQSTLQELEGRRNVLVSDIRGKEQRLQSLKPKIEKLINVSQPIQDLLGVKFEDSEKDCQQKQLALNLPSALTIIHVHSTAYKEIMDDKYFDVKIVEKEVENIKIAKLEKDSDKTKNENRIEDKVEEKSDDLFDSHPLCVELDIGSAENDVKISIFFHYLTELKIVTMRWELKGNFKSKNPVLNSETFLSELFENDSGEDCPVAVGQLKLNQLKKSISEIAKTLGKPYKFVQKLAGANNDLSGVQITDFLKVFISAVRERVKTRLSLEAVLKSLESKKTEQLNVGELSNIKILSFKHCDEEKFIASIPSSLTKMIENAKISDRFPFKAELEDSIKKQKLTAWISIPANYPKSSSLFGLTTSVENVEQNIEDVENKLNNPNKCEEDLIKQQFSTLIKNFELIFTS